MRIRHLNRFVRSDNPPDIIFMGVGENGHIAFNDPHIAFFDDPLGVKIVDLDLKCRNQQVNDACFETIDDVPTHAITLTIPTLMKAARIFVIVPTALKADAIGKIYNGEITQACPASILRTHKAATLYTDVAGAHYRLNNDEQNLYLYRGVVAIRCHSRLWKTSCSYRRRAECS